MTSRDRRRVATTVALAAFASIGGLSPALAATSVGVFYNSSYVATSTEGGGEAYNIRQSLASQGNTVSTFTGFADADWVTAFSLNQVVVIPELFGNLGGALTPAARTTITNAVAAGKGLIVFGDFGSADVTLLNNVFATTVANGSSYQAAETISRTAAATGTPFASAPASVPANDATATITTASVPGSYKSMYTIGANTAVFTNGTGRLVFLAYDWFNAAPVGSQDGGWSSVLAAAVASSGASRTVTWTGSADATDGVAGAGGHWPIGGNWAGGYGPLATDDAVFNLAGTYNVNLTANAAARNLSVAQGNVSLNLASHTLAAQDLLSVSGTGGSAALSVSGTAGSLLSAAKVDVGSTTGGGTLTLSGVASTTNSALDHSIGDGGFSGQLTLVNGSSMTTAGAVRVAHSSNGSTTGLLEVKSGSQLNVPTLIIASGTGMTLGAALVDNATMNVSGNLGLAGTDTTAGSGQGALTIQNNGSVNVAGAAKVWAGGTLALSAGTLNVGSLALTSPAGLQWTGGTLGLNGGATTLTSLTVPAGGTLNLNGGTLTLTTAGTAIGGGNPASTVNFNGTTLKPTASSTSWIQGLSSAKIQAGGATFNTNGFNVTIAQNLAHDPALGATPDGGLTKSGAGTLTLTGTPTYTGGTTVQAGTLLVNRLHENNPVNIAGGILQVVESSPGLGTGHPSGDDARVSRPSSLTIAPAGTLDLTNNDLIIDYSGASPVAAYEALVASAYNIGVGDWSGPGITSTIAQLDGNYVLAIADNALLAAPFGTANGGPLFAGVDVDIDTILIKFTHRVDVDLDGVITPNDAAIFGGNYSENDPAVWSTGDMDYDGIYTPNDAAIFGGFYDESLTSLPEPGSLSALVFLTLGPRRRSLRR